MTNNSRCKQLANYLLYHLADLVISVHSPQFDALLFGQKTVDTTDFSCKHCIQHKNTILILKLFR